MQVALSDGTIIDVDSKIISQRLKNALSYAGMSFGDITLKTGIPRSSVQRYLNGSVEKYQMSRLCAIALATDVDISYIIGVSDDMKPDSSLKTIKEPAAPKGSGPELPPGYEKLTPENKELIDKMIATLSKSQFGQ